MDQERRERRKEREGEWKADSSVVESYYLKSKDSPANLPLSRIQR